MSKKENLGTGESIEKPEVKSRKTDDIGAQSVVTFAFIICPPELGCAYKHTCSKPVLQTATYLK